MARPVSVRPMALNRSSRWSALGQGTPRAGDRTDFQSRQSRRHASGIFLGSRDPIRIRRPLESCVEYVYSYTQTSSHQRHRLSSDDPVSLEAVSTSPWFLAERETASL